MGNKFQSFSVPIDQPIYIMETKGFYDGLTGAYRPEFYAHLMTADMKSSSEQSDVDIDSLFRQGFSRCTFSRVWGEDIGVWGNDVVNVHFVRPEDKFHVSVDRLDRREFSIIDPCSQGDGRLKMGRVRLTQELQTIFGISEKLKRIERGMKVSY